MALVNVGRSRKKHPGDEKRKLEQWQAAANLFNSTLH